MWALKITLVFYHSELKNLVHWLSNQSILSYSDTYVSIIFIDGAKVTYTSSLELLDHYL